MQGEESEGSRFRVRGEKKGIFLDEKKLKNNTFFTAVFSRKA
jgi:hypothetical protein